jgi:hypothetical protein
VLFRCLGLSGRRRRHGVGGGRTGTGRKLARGCYARRDEPAIG